MGVKVFLTGAGGYLGSMLATQLASMSEIDNITGIDITLPPSPFPDKVNLIKMDTRSPKLADAMSGHDFVIHCASIVQ
jgi:nucleoside-diphosphate-sugar epimerase